jgi:hypothetical protein
MDQSKTGRRERTARNDIKLSHFQLQLGWLFPPPCVSCC